ncbi:type II secretion system protein PulP [Geobacter hydrogenophilus]|uniref:type II secretion system protein PulP n=2 Tax=Geobacter hydrogenophilus TaxID=40983 RepID=UPI001BDABF05|nr:type II secretion system protein PulP [Geobacter hydrogenophilus]MBT0893163.1 type II secretion system protein PulP [Geobacter hydrogenophilus]
MNRQRLILSILLVVFVVAAIVSYIRMPRQQTVSKVPPPPAKVSRSPKPTGAVATDDRKLRLDLLECTSNRFAGFRRNIFRPIFRGETKQSRPLPMMLPKAVPPPPPAAPVALPPPMPVAPQPPQVVRDMAKFTFLGFLKKDNHKTIFLARDKEIILVRQGDKIAGNYEATTITDEALSIRSLTDGSEMVIPLVENRPLAGQIR